MSFDVNYIAGLANLTLDENEKHSVQEKMEGILHFVEKIQELDLGEYSPCISSYEMPTVLREDQIGVTLTQQDLQMNTPKLENGSIIVPQVIQK